VYLGHNTCVTKAATYGVNWFDVCYRCPHPDYSAWPCETGLVSTSTDSCVAIENKNPGMPIQHNQVCVPCPSDTDAVVASLEFCKMQPRTQFNGESINNFQYIERFYYIGQTACADKAKSAGVSIGAACASKCPQDFYPSQCPVGQYYPGQTQCWAASDKTGLLNIGCTSTCPTTLTGCLDQNNTIMSFYVGQKECQNILNTKTQGANFRDMCPYCVPDDWSFGSCRSKPGTRYVGEKVCKARRLTASVDDICAVCPSDADGIAYCQTKRDNPYYVGFAACSSRAEGYGFEEICRGCYQGPCPNGQVYDRNKCYSASNASKIYTPCPVSQ
jgi:hypothetical protein